MTDSAAQPSPRENDQAKKAERINELVQEFRSTAGTSGIRVDAYDPETDLSSQGIFYLDKMMEKMTLQVAFAAPRTFSPLDITEVTKEREFSSRVPAAEHVCSRCVGIQFATEPDEVTCLRFIDKTSRDDFYTALKVLTMSLKSTVDSAH